MSKGELSRETVKEIDRLVERVARKSGYSGGVESYEDHLQRKYEQKREKLRLKVAKYRRERRLKPSDAAFAEEIRAYLGDGIAEMMDAGKSEAEALALTKEKFDEAEPARSFEEFMRAFDDFGVEDYKIITQQWYHEHGEAIGLFYAAFLVLCSAGGALAGFLLGGGRELFLAGGWINTVVGWLVGAAVGIGLGLLSNAIIVSLRRER